MSGEKLRLLGFRHAFGLGAMQSMLRLVLGFISIKVTAVTIGPAGLALVAQLGSFINLWQGVLANPAGTAMVRLGSEFADQPEIRRQVLATVFRLVMGASLVFAAIAAAFSGWLSPIVLAGENHQVALILAVVAVPVVAFTSIVSAAFNSIGELGAMVRVQMWGAVAGFLVFVPAAYFFGVDGALIGTAAAYYSAAMVAAWILRDRGAALWADIASKPSAEMLRRTLSFYPMLLVHAGLTPLSLLILRDQMVAQVGLDQTGLWQAGWRLSEIYLGILMAPFSMYFIPKLGVLINDGPGFSREVWHSIGRSALFTLVCALGILLLREWIVRLVLSRNFMPVVDLLPWQLAADVLKMAAWILSMTLTVLLRAGWYVFCEVARLGAFVGLAFWLIGDNGAVAANWAYFASSAIHIAIAAFALRDVLWPAAIAKARE